MAKKASLAILLVGAYLCSDSLLVLAMPKLYNPAEALNCLKIYGKSLYHKDLDFDLETPSEARKLSIEAFQLFHDFPVTGELDYDTVRKLSVMTCRGSDDDEAAKAAAKRQLHNDHPHWSYNGEHGPNLWGETYVQCSGQRQSPVNLDIAVAERGDFNLDYFGYNSELQQGTAVMTNDGHSLKVSIEGVDIGLSGGGLGPIGSQFKLAQFHFHWGSNDCRGSEHTVEGRAYPAELHMVHYNTKYPGFQEASEEPDGLAVLAVFLDIGPNSHPTLETLQKGLPFVPFGGDTFTNLGAFTMSGLLPRDQQSFARYQGSLTTPACYESVTWTVLNEPIFVSSKQMDGFRSLRSSAVGEAPNVPLKDNFRPVQPLNARPFYVTYDRSIRPTEKANCQ